MVTLHHPGQGWGRSTSDSPGRSISRPHLHTTQGPQKRIGPQPSQVIEQPAIFSLPASVSGPNESWPDGRVLSPQSSLSLAVSALYRIPREGSRSGSSTKAKGFPRPHPVSQCGNHPAGRLPGSQAVERKKGPLRVASSSHAGRCQLKTAWLCA